jgi:hypothetical protein
MRFNGGARPGKGDAEQARATANAFRNLLFRKPAVDEWLSADGASVDRLLIKP